MKDRKVKIISLVAIIVAVIGLTIAFAAMSRTLKINGSSNIDPANFDIHFKNVTFKEKTPTASTSGTPTPTNNDKGPTIDNIRVTLSQPNDYVTYTADIENEGDIDAEINNITLPTLTNEQKELFEFSVVYTNNGEAPKKGDMLAHGEVRNITITFRYKDITDENLLPDSPKTIDLSYSIEFIQSNTKVITTQAVVNNCTSFEKKDVYTLGDTIAICNESTGKSEDFYIISDNGDTVTALAKYNLYVGRIYNSSSSYVEIDSSDENYGIQNSKAIGYYKSTHPMYEENGNKLYPVVGVVSFAGTNYWNGNTSGYPAWVFNSNSNLWIPIQNYEYYLTNTIGKTSAKVTILSYDQASVFKCSGSSCSSNTPWAYSTSYWLGTAYNSSIIYALYSYGKYDYYSYARNGYCGIRPVITINKSEL